MTTYTLQGFDLPALHRKFIGFDPLFEDLTRAFHNKNDNYPPYNIVRVDESRFVIEIAIAGFQESELDVSLTNRILNITGKRRIDATASEKEYLHRGISSRDFERTFTLGEHMEVVGASVKNGILTVTLDQQIPDEAKTRRIAISSESTSG